MFQPVAVECTNQVFNLPLGQCMKSKLL